MVLQSGSSLLRVQGTAKAMALLPTDRAAVRAHAQAAQWDEWDDEYDDSFDDLGVSTLEGRTEIEGGMALLCILPLTHCLVFRCALPS